MLGNHFSLNIKDTTILFTVNLITVHLSQTFSSLCVYVYVVLASQRLIYK